MAIGPKRAEARGIVATLVERAAREFWSVRTFRKHVDEVATPDSDPRLRRLLCEELRRAGMPIRALPDHRQLCLFKEAS